MTIMRRFIAYMSLAIAGLATVAVTFNAAFTKTNSNIEYTDGRALIFRVSDEENEELPSDAASEIAKTMQKRLDIYGETRYDIVTEGNDTIKVVLAEDQDGYYSELKRYLSFNGAFALGTSSNTVAIGEEFMDTTKDAYVTFVNYYPTVVIPIKKDSEEFQAVIEEANKLKDESSSTTDETTGETTETTTYVYLAYNFVEGEDTISSLIEGSEDYDAVKYEEKFLMRFDISNIYLNEDETSIATSVNIDQNGDGSTSTAEMAYATHMAKYTINLLNSDELPYDVEYIFEYSVPAYFENLISYGMRANVAWSRTLIATIFAILIISLVLAVFYRWGAVAIGSISIVAPYIGLLLAILFTVEFNTASIIGLCAVALASIASGIIYLSRVKDECYRGRTLRKANSEGAKKALLPILDINVILIIVGACVYWLGGSTMAGFASIAVFGGLASLILNILALRGMMWLLTNTTKFVGKYEVIGVDSKNVPNILNEEKQTYYGPYQNVDPTKHKKVFGIVFSILFVASLIGTITFGVLNKGVIFNDGDYSKDATYLYVETKTNDSTINQAYVENLLSRTFIYENVEEVEKDNSIEKVYTPLSVASVESYKNVKTEDDVEVTYHYIMTTFGKNYTGQEIAVITENGLNEDGTLSTIVVSDTLLEEVFSSYLSLVDVDFNATASLKVGTKVSAQQPDYTWIVISTCVGAAFAMLYLMIRYGLSKGLTSIIFVTLTGFICAGVFCLSRMVVGLDLFIALPFVIAITLIAAIIYMSKEKEIVNDDLTRNKDNSIEHRYELMVKANALSLGPIFVFGAVGIYLTINFFGFGVSQTANLFLFALLGCVLGIALVSLLYGPTSIAIYKVLRKLNIKKPNLKPKRKKKIIKNKSAEPEEAVFIGIND